MQNDKRLVTKQKRAKVLQQVKRVCTKIKVGKRLDPFCPDYLLEDEGICYYWLREFEKSVESFGKLKVPSRNSLFYLAATYSKRGETELAKTCLAEAVSVTNLTISDFMNTQYYKSDSDSNSLRTVLENITGY